MSKAASWTHCVIHKRKSPSDGDAEDAGELDRQRPDIFQLWKAWDDLGEDEQHLVSHLCIAHEVNAKMFNDLLMTVEDAECRHIICSLVFWLQVVCAPEGFECFVNTATED